MLQNFVCIIRKNATISQGQDLVGTSIQHKALSKSRLNAISQKSAWFSESFGCRFRRNNWAIFSGSICSNTVKNAENHIIV
jgi:hypothetical protein